MDRWTRYKVKLAGANRLAEAVQLIQATGEVLMVNRRRCTVIATGIDEALAEALCDKGASVVEEYQYDLDTENDA